MALSVYTHYLVEGIRTGGADQDEDGWIAVEELHAYASGKVREAAPAMTPEFYPVKEDYKILIAKAPQDDPRLKYRKQVKQRANQGRFTIPARQLLNSWRSQLGLTPEVAEAIEAEELQPYREYQRKLQDYEQTVVDTLAEENPPSPIALADLRDYQEHLALLDADVAAINTQLLGKSLPAPPIADPPPPDRRPTFAFDVIIVNAQSQETKRDRHQAEYFSETLDGQLTLDMVDIPGGSFQMGTAQSERDSVIQEYIKAGAEKADAEKWVGWEMPQHPVAIAPFFLGKYAVTQAQWKIVAGWSKANRDLGNGTNTVQAGSGNNRITTGNGNDTIESKSGDDFINAGDGNNTVRAGGGSNTIFTGSGND